MIEEDLDRVEKCINRNLMKCHKRRMKTQCALAHKTQSASRVAGGSALPLG